MRVPDIQARTLEQVTAASKASADSQEAKKTAGTPEAAATVNLSARAKELAAQVSDGVDEAKVSRLKAAVEDGSFKVDPQEIAKRIVGE